MNLEPSLKNIEVWAHWKLCEFVWNLTRCLLRMVQFFHSRRLTCCPDPMPSPTPSPQGRAPTGRPVFIRSLHLENSRGSFHSLKKSSREFCLIVKNLKGFKSSSIITILNILKTTIISSIISVVRITHLTGIWINIQ